MKRLALGALALLALALIAAVVVLEVWKSSGRPWREGAHTLSGLDGEVRVRFDEWAVPHVEAGSARDLSMALGWLHANDRLTQMELGRRAASGRLAEIVGEVALQADIQARRLQLRATAERMLTALAPESLALLEAYATGVNAWLRERDGDLPPDLRLLRVVPEIWQPADSLCFCMLMARDLNYPLAFEERRFDLLRGLGVERTLDYLDLGQTPPAPEIVALAGQSSSANGSAASPSAGEFGRSNNWAVGASRAKHGAPLVAGDPHLGLGLPSLWYEAVLAAPDYRAAGMTLPGLPLVVIGQGASVAWSVTNTEIDCADLFFEELDPAGRAVRRGFSWAPLIATRETIRVKGAADVELELFTSDRGPLFPADPARKLPARTLAWTMYTPFDPLAPFVATARAESVSELPAAIENYVGPAQNLIAADRHGGLCFTLLGRFPERGNGTGKFAEPGWDPGSAWKGLLPANASPRLFDPTSGWLATANNDTRVLGHAFAPRAEYAAPWRFERIAELVGARADWTAEELAQVQNDVLARSALALVTELPGDLEGDAELAAAALRGWDGRMDRSGAAALFALFEKELGELVVNDEFDQGAIAPPSSLGRNEFVARLSCGRADPIWYDDVRTEAVEGQRTMFERALARALRVGSERFGSKIERWSWAELNQWRAEHPMGDAPLLGRRFERGPFGLQGATHTIDVHTGNWRDDQVRAEHGASMRMVCDTADPDRSRTILPGGQSGHPFDDHYDDQLAGYLEGRTKPVSWSPAACEASQRSLLVLEP